MTDEAVPETMPPALRTAHCGWCERVREVRKNAGSSRWHCRYCGTRCLVGSGTSGMKHPRGFLSHTIRETTDITIHCVKCQKQCGVRRVTKRLCRDGYEEDTSSLLCLVCGLDYSSAIIDA